MTRHSHPSSQAPVLPTTARENTAYWLGQAGFWIDLGGTRILIDPYLSDSLAEKYAGTKFPHTRMMAIPVHPRDLPSPHIVLITHGHTDHMDGATLSVLAECFPNIRFIVPAAEEALARARIDTNAKLELVTSGDNIDFGEGSITVFPAAHEVRKRDTAGNDHYLGYGIDCDGVRIYHSGDTVPFDTLTPLLRRFHPDIALLPVNGRDQMRATNGVPGNMTMQEAIALCQKCKIPRLIPHHFGLFEFNTASNADLAMAGDAFTGLNVELPSLLSPIPLASSESKSMGPREQNRR